ncbi:unnamed protein product [Heterobilharzia americana]|nr:unnamed protein product [Heterobilharzia americana]
MCLGDKYEKYILNLEILNLYIKKEKSGRLQTSCSPAPFNAILTHTVYITRKYLILVFGGITLFASVVYIRFYKLTVERPNKLLYLMSQCSPLIKKMSWGSITVETVSEDGTSIQTD